MKPETGLVMIIALVILWMFSGCVNWQQTTHKSLEAAHKIGKLAHLEATNDVCRPTINKCKELRVSMPDHKCEALTKCQKIRRDVIRATESLQRAVLLGLVAIQLGNELSSQTALRAAGMALITIKDGLETWGVKL